MKLPEDPSSHLYLMGTWTKFQCGWCREVVEIKDGDLDDARLQGDDKHWCQGRAQFVRSELLRLAEYDLFEQARKLSEQRSDGGAR